MSTSNAALNLPQASSVAAKSSGSAGIAIVLVVLILIIIVVVLVLSQNKTTTPPTTNTTIETSADSSGNNIIISEKYELTITNLDKLTNFTWDIKKNTAPSDDYTPYFTADFDVNKLILTPVANITDGFTLILTADSVANRQFNLSVNVATVGIILSKNTFNTDDTTKNYTTITNFSALTNVKIKSSDDKITAALDNDTGEISFYGTINEIGDFTIAVSADNTTDATIQINIVLADPYEFDEDVTYTPPTRIIGYFTNWAQYRNEDGEDDPHIYLPSMIPVDSLTEIIYAFFAINDNGEVKYSDAWGDLSKETIKNVVALKNTGKVTSVRFCVGGWTYSGPNKIKCFDDINDTEGTINTKDAQDIWHEICTDPTIQSNFITSAKAMADLHGFDGIDIDYEYPVCPQGVCDNKYIGQQKGFVEFLKNLRAAFGTQVISIATAAAKAKMNAGYKTADAAQYVDYLNVMTYDYHVSAEEISGHNQPKYDSADGFDVNYTMWSYIKAGVDPSKLNVGVALYSRGYQLSDENFANAIATNVYSGYPIVGPSPATKYTQEAGTAGFYEFHGLYTGPSVFIDKEGSWIADTTTKSIISYTDIKDMKAIDDIRRKKKIGGVMYYCIDQDHYLDASTYGVKNPILENFPIITTVEKEALWTYTPTGILTSADTTDPDPITLPVKSTYTLIISNYAYLNDFTFKITKNTAPSDDYSDYFSLDESIQNKLIFTQIKPIKDGFTLTLSATGLPDRTFTINLPVDSPFVFYYVDSEGNIIKDNEETSTFIDNINLHDHSSTSFTFTKTPPSNYTVTVSTDGGTADIDPDRVMLTTENIVNSAKLTFLINDTPSRVVNYNVIYTINLTYYDVATTTHHADDITNGVYIDNLKFHVAPPGQDEYSFKFLKNTSDVTAKISSDEAGSVSDMTIFGFTYKPPATQVANFTITLTKGTSIRVLNCSVIA